MRNKLYTCNEIVICRLKTEIIGGIFMNHNNITFCLKVPYFTTNAVLHTHPLKFFNLVIVHTLDFRYMIKNK